MYWRCLLGGELRRRASEAAEEIVAGVAKAGALRGGLDGAAGQALLLLYGAQASGDAGLVERASELMDEAVAGVAERPGLALWGGAAGVRFAVAHAAGGDEAAEAVGMFDAALRRALEVERWEWDYDLIGGLCGVGIGALEGNLPEGLAIGARVLDHLEALARPDLAGEPRGTTWFTSPALLPDWQRALCPDGYLNLGLAHGVPGVIGFLARLIEAGVEVERARALLAAAARWMVTVVPARAPARYPAWIGRGAGEEPARLAWCYGDAGVAVALLAAARALGDEELETEARGLARTMAARRFEDSGVRDMGLCHGAAGLAHIFNRLYQATGDEEVGEAARRWFAQLLAMRRPGEAIGGFPAREVHDEVESWTPDASLIMGATGVGLALLAATTEIEPAWDRALLCDVAPRGEAG